MTDYLNMPILTTYSGTDVNVVNPNPDSLKIIDIAHALSNICRYGGHSKVFYSVADHCVNMYEHFMDRGQYVNAYIALMHDATEAYLCDIPRPIKPFIVGYKELEDNLAKAIYKKFNVPAMTEAVEVIDYHIIYNEVMRVNNIIPDWINNYDDYDVYIYVSHNQNAASNRFLEAYYEVTKLLNIKGE